MSDDPDRRETGGDLGRRQREEAARARIEQQTSWVDLQVRQAMARGDFDDLPGLGRPIEDLGGSDDPDWWVRRLVEREKITGVLPPSLLLRREDAELDARLDTLAREDDVRRAVADFNERVRWALYRPPEGPPMVTRPRDADTEVARWAERRAAAREERRRRAEERAAATPEPQAPWWRRRRRHRPPTPGASPTPADRDAGAARQTGEAPEPRRGGEG